MRNGVKPIWVFDSMDKEGMPEKILELEKRRDLKIFNEQRKNDSLKGKDLETALKYAKRSAF
jgi:flap endonuclease-1